MLPATQQQPTTFDVVVDLVRAVRVLALDRPVEVIESQRRFVAFQVEPGPQAIEVGQPGSSWTARCNCSRARSNLFSPAVGLGQVDIGLVRLRLPLDR